MSRCTPEPVKALSRRPRLVFEAISLKRRAQSESLDRAFERLWESSFRPFQVRSEAVRFFELVRAQRPRYVCEIGAAGGGTAFLFTRVMAPAATLVSVDLDYGETRAAAVSRFARRGQRVHCLTADSHDPATVTRLRELLKGNLLDCLFIDGDHRYEGVKSDFELYAPLVRAGGMIAFHDIVEDEYLRTGVRTTADVGGVPRFWAELRSGASDCMEIVEDPAQDGCGIGIVFVAA